LVNYTITKNLSTTLTDSTEENWQDAFQGIALINYKSLWIDGRIKLAMDEIQNHSPSFQRALLELNYGNYKNEFYQQVKFLLLQTENSKIFAMCAAYILQSSHGKEDANFLSVKTKQQIQKDNNNPILLQLLYQLDNYGKMVQVPDLKALLQKNYLPGQVLLFSFQRKNRDYPGIVMVRDRNGNFIKDSTGEYFCVPQLARSVSNLPAYLTNGNTPQGIFRMKGYDVSRAGFIGPTVNVQLTMPFEKSPCHFYADSSITDTTWNLSYYRNLLPASLKDYFPLYESYYAGKAGRTEIIIHGTTVNPEYYLHQPYYPLTPTQGCLTSKEIWNGKTGQRSESDQQKLINTMIKAGGAQGYCIVINIDDEQRPVSLNDILPFFK
ncbi:MAG: hypothetical protein ABJA37_08940, partial [Ferruginibacter sp.]